MSASASKKRRSRNRFDSIPDVTQLSMRIDSRNRRRRLSCTDSQGQYRGQPETDANSPHFFETSALRAEENGRLGVMQDDEDEPVDELDEMIVPSQEFPSEQELAVGLTTTVKIPTVKIPNWRVLWSLLMTNGNRRITKSQYQSVRILAETFASQQLGSWLFSASPPRTSSVPKKKLSSLPHFSTLHNVFKPILEHTLVPRAFDFREAVDLSKSGARATLHTADGGAHTTIRIILPSEYARADVSTCSTFDSICSTSLESLRAQGIQGTYASSISASDCVDIWPLVAAREWYYGPTQSASVDSNEPNATISSFCEAGDILKVSFIGQDPLSEPLLNLFPCASGGSGYNEVQGIVIHVWSVHHMQRAQCGDYYPREIPELSQRDKQIVQRFSFSAYCSPTDSVTVEIPELPVEEEADIQAQNCPSARQKSPEMAEAIKLRRAALKARRREMESAWRRWRKPLLKPSDIVVMLGQPPGVSSSNCARPARLFIVHRFWTEAEERPRHIFWIPSGTVIPTTVAQDPCSALCATIGTTSSELFRDVLRVTLLRTHAGERGARRYAPVSSVGTLENGEKYVIYRFILFWDAFEIAAGKSASGEGVYLMCLNFPVRDRSTPSAVRIISLTPPGVKSNAVLARIQEDILKGMTEGFLDIDANGQLRRIFLDLEGFIGDTPAINAALDVQGHTASACCHLCRFVRCSSTLIGSRYTRTPANGSLSAFGRTFYHHTAITDCAPEKETCRLMGMKAQPNHDALPIHSLRAAMISSRARIPTTENGTPILSGYLDPYRSCLIAPDHLLTGHARDLINLAFKLLPSRLHLATCEHFMIGMLSDCGLPKQNRLVDHETKKLYSMSMTDVYALLFIAELGFLIGCKKADCVPQHKAPLSSKARSAIALTGSFSRVVTALWYIPREERDGEEAVTAFESDNGNFNVRKIQHLASSHIEKVRSQCTMPDADVLTLQDPECDRSTRSQLSNIQSACLTAVKTIDKPNVHRLQELVCSTLPMVGHISRIGELVLEKAHQGLKAAVKLSNKKQVQITAMKSVAMTDWQGRLSTMVPDALRGDKDALRGCFRLLAGRESVLSLCGILQDMHIKEVMRALGPACCVPQELELQRMSILSPRATKTQNISWKLGGSVEVLHSNSSSSSAARRDAFCCIIKSYPFDNQTHTILMGDYVSSSLPCGRPGPYFGEGDVVETPCFFPLQLDMHFPFLMQPGDLTARQNSAFPVGSSLWCITSVFAISQLAGKSSFFATVLPCVLITNPPNEHAVSHRNKYKVRKPTTSTEWAYSIARLDEKMRKVGILHDCDPRACTALPSEGTISHCSGSKTLEEGVFYVFSRKNGFPPRQG